MKKSPRVILFIVFILSGQLSIGQKSAILPVKTTYNIQTLDVDTIPSDTLTSGSQIYHPLYSSFPIWYELGNLGFPALPAYWTGISRLNEPTYIRTIRQYAAKANELTFYETNSPFAMLTYTSGGTKDINGQVINAVFARHITPSLKVWANLDFINSDGHYLNQKSSHSDFSVNADYHKNRYTLKVGVESLSFNLGENGGLTDKGISFPWSETNPAQRSVNLPGGASSTNWTIIKGRQEFDFLEPKRHDSIEVLDAEPMALDSISMTDSLWGDNIVSDTSLLEIPFPDSSQLKIFAEATPVRPKSKPKLFHTFDYQFSKRLYKDEQDNTSSYYSEYLIDTLAAADSMNFKIFSNQIGISHGGYLSDSLSWKGQAGIKHSVSSWYSNNLGGTFQQLGVFADAKARYMGWNLILNAKFNPVGYGAGAYEFGSVFGRIPTDKSWSFNFEFSSILDLPSIFHESFSGNHDYWNFDTKMQAEQRFSLNAFERDLQLGAAANVNLISNWAYFDESGVSQQSAYSSILLSGNIQKHFKLGPFNSRNQVFLQYTPAKEIPLPLVVASTSTFMHHDIHFEKTKGKLEIEYGVDLRYASPYKGYAYRPSSGVFYLQDGKMLGNYPYLDLFFIMRVKRTRVFVKWEHVNEGLTGENFFPVLNYPVKVRFIKYGVYWHFYD